METEDKLATVLCGVAGEYFVAAELSRRGYVASLTLRNTRGIDVLASNSNATRAVGIQVKTNQNDRREWILNKKAEADVAENLFYIFVRLNRTSMPAFHGVPRSNVAEFVRTDHAAWLKSPGKGGRAHVDSVMRKFRDSDDQYLGRWDLLGLDELPNPAVIRHGACWKKSQISFAAWKSRLELPSRRMPCLAGWGRA